MREVLKNIRWYIDIFKCITSIGVYISRRRIHIYTHVYRIYAVVKHMETHTERERERERETHTQVYAKVHDYGI